MSKHHLNNRKLRFARCGPRYSKREAIQEKHRVRELTGNRHLGIARCAHCGGWHVYDGSRN